MSSGIETMYFLHLSRNLRDIIKLRLTQMQCECDVSKYSPGLNSFVNMFRTPAYHHYFCIGQDRLEASSKDFCPSLCVSPRSHRWGLGGWDGGGWRGAVPRFCVSVHRKKMPDGDFDLGPVIRVATVQGAGTGREGVV